MNDPAVEWAAPETDRPAVVRLLPDLLTVKDARAAGYLKALEEREAPLPDEEQRDRALALVTANPGLLPRVAELARAAAESASLTISRLLLDWCTHVLRKSRDRHSEWLTSGNRPEYELRQLVDEFAKCAKSKDDRPAAEARLSIGMAILTARSDFEPLDAVRVLGEELGGEKSGLSRNRDRKNGLKLLRKSGARQLENLGLIARLYDEALSEARRRQIDAETAKRENYDRYIAARHEIDQRDAHIRQLTAQLAELKARADNLGHELTGVKGDAAQGEIELKARYRQFLNRRLMPFLNDARDALANEPPSLKVAGQRVGFIQTEIERELAWLDRFSD